MPEIGIGGLADGLDIYGTRSYIASMSLYKTRPFARLAAKAEITDRALKKSAEEIGSGLIHADLGGNVFKQRVALPGRGKRGGCRVIVVADLKEDRWIFVHCYLKKDRDNITDDEENAFRELARIYLNLSGEDIQAAVTSGILEEIL